MRLPDSALKTERTQNRTCAGELFAERDPQDVFRRTGVTGAQQLRNVREYVRCPGPSEPLGSLRHREPFVRLVFLGRSHLVRVDKRTKDDRELHAVLGSEIERVHGNAIQPLRRQAGLLPQFPDRGLRRCLPGLDPAMDGFPRAGAAGVGGALQREHSPAATGDLHDIHIDDTDAYLCHRYSRLRAWGARAASGGAPTARGDGTAW